MTRVELQSVRKVYAGDIPALLDICLTIESGQRYVLAGPSGCGKTTLLRIIAGLEQPDEGRVLFDGRDMAGVEPKDRRVSMVFQNALLYPHLSAFENLAFAMRVEGIKGEKEIRSAVHQMAEMLGIADLLGRMPGQISGGQAQRVAIGKAFLREPAIVLLDEPMSHLDGPLKDRIEDLIITLQRQRGLTIVYVTHDQTEAFSLADRICLLDRGLIQQVGTSRDIFYNPANSFVDQFFRRLKVPWVEKNTPDIQEKGKP